MIARRLGLRVVLLERGRHPRFAIGESASPLAGILIEQLADRYDLPRLRPLAAFGDWQRAYPDVVCGLKRGFTYFKHDDGRRIARPPIASNQLLVAASPSDELSDTHWLRADVDHFLVREAVALGVDYLDRCELERRRVAAGWRPGARRRAARDERLRIRARFVVDAIGPARIPAAGRLDIDDRGFDGYPADAGAVLALHRRGALRRHARLTRSRRIAMRQNGPSPYPMDDAALHHVFDGGWMWVLRFGNGVTSAGVAVEDWLAEDLRLADGEPAWPRLLARYPSVAAQFAGARRSGRSRGCRGWPIAPPTRPASAGRCCRRRRRSSIRCSRPGSR